ncbi:MAG: hypothetical protein QXP55_01480 [Nitrososphaerales archaeon]
MQSSNWMYTQHVNNIHIPITFNQKVVVFVGTVGAGKSTQMKLLASMLESRRLKIRITYIKTGHVFAYLLEILLARVLCSKRKDVYPIRALIENRAFIFKKLFRLWLILDMLSISIRFILTVFLPSKIGRVILVEEYIPATIADYIYLAKAVGFPVKYVLFAVNYVLKLLHLCNPILTIFLDASNSCLVDRWHQRGSLNETSDYLKMQRTLLLNVSKNLSNYFLYINTSNKTIKEVHKLIVNYLKSKCKE